MTGQQNPLADAGSSAGLRDVVVSGGSGLVGRALTNSLAGRGFRVRHLVRRPPRDALEIPWNPAEGTLDPAALEGCQGLVHLAGEPVDGRWTRAKKERILESRVRGTTLLAETVARLERPPEVWVQASAIGFYGDRGDELLPEDAGAGEGFLSGVCVAWEGAARAPASTRLVILRIGMVLAEEGGALAKMVPPFRLGLGGRLGSGRQIVSWISLRDLVAAIEHALAEPSLDGPVNAVSPRPVPQQELTAALGKILRRPTPFPVPAFGLRALLGEMAEDLLLASTRVSSEKLRQSGFEFSDPEIEGALRGLLGT